MEEYSLILFDFKFVVYDYFFDGSIDCIPGYAIV